MDPLDERIQAGLRERLQRHEPSPHLWDAIQKGLQREQRRRQGLVILAFTALAGLAGIVASPAARAWARAVARVILNWEKGPVKISVKVDENAPPPDPEALSTSPGRLEATWSIPAQEFRGDPGTFPEEARAALRAPFVVPSWLPPELPVRVEVLPSPNEDNAKPKIDVVTIWLGNRIRVTETAVTGATDIRVGVQSQASAKPVQLGSLSGVEVQDDETLEYWLHTPGLVIHVRGPLEDAEILRRLAESLVKSPEPAGSP